jgi:hypothetical protein
MKYPAHIRAREDALQEGISLPLLIMSVLSMVVTDKISNSLALAGDGSGSPIVRSKLSFIGRVKTGFGAL